jgi:hypothetical protein
MVGKSVNDQVFQKIEEHASPPEMSMPPIHTIRTRCIDNFMVHLEVMNQDTTESQESQLKRAT